MLLYISGRDVRLRVVLLGCIVITSVFAVYCIRHLPTWRTQQQKPSALDCANTESNHTTNQAKGILSNLDANSAKSQQKELKVAKTTTVHRDLSPSRNVLADNALDPANESNHQQSRTVNVRLAGQVFALQTKPTPEGATEISMADYLQEVKDVQNEVLVECEYFAHMKMVDNSYIHKIKMYMQ